MPGGFHWRFLLDKLMKVRNLKYFIELWTLMCSNNEIISFFFNPNYYNYLISVRIIN